jgi:hypothetical protein
MDHIPCSATRCVAFPRRQGVTQSDRQRQMGSLCPANTPLFPPAITHGLRTGPRKRYQDTTVSRANQPDATRMGTRPVKGARRDVGTLHWPVTRRVQVSCIEAPVRVCCSRACPHAPKPETPLRTAAATTWPCGSINGLRLLQDLCKSQVSGVGFQCSGTPFSLKPEHRTLSTPLAEGFCKWLN